MNFKALLGGLPPTIQYLIIMTVVMLILYFCLILTHKIAGSRGKMHTFDDNDENDKSVPDIFASTMFKRKPKETDAETNETENEKPDEDKSEKREN